MDDAFLELFGLISCRQAIADCWLVDDDGRMRGAALKFLPERANGDPEIIRLVFLGRAQTVPSLRLYG